MLRLLQHELYQMCTYTGFYKGKRTYPLIAPEIYFKVKSLTGGSELMSFELWKKKKKRD